MGTVIDDYVFDAEPPGTRDVAVELTRRTGLPSLLEPEPRGVPTSLRRDGAPWARLTVREVGDGVDIIAEGGRVSVEFHSFPPSRFLRGHLAATLRALGGRAASVDLDAAAPETPADGPEDPARLWTELSAAERLAEASPMLRAIRSIVAGGD